MPILCFDIGGTDIKYGIVENEVILEKGSMPTNPYLGQENVSNRFDLVFCHTAGKKVGFCLFLNVIAAVGSKAVLNIFNKTNIHIIF